MKTKRNIFKQIIVLAICFSLIEGKLLQNANAGMISTSVVVADISREKNKQTIAAFLNRADVQHEFMKYGVSPQEASARIAALSDLELQKLAGNIGNAPAGADVIVISLTTILLVVIVLLILGRI